jgi:hypothetical protein
MAVKTARPPVTTESTYVNDGAVRLFLAGYLTKLQYNTEEDGHLYYSIPSESGTGLYQIDYCPRQGTLRCTCKAGENNVPCKHVRLFQLRNGWAVEARG